MKELSPTQRRELKARAHALHPVVSIASKGLAPTVLAEIDKCLTAHELIKVRTYGAEKDVREALMVELCTQLEAAPVQHIGNILIIFRENPPEEAPAQAPVRKTSKTAAPGRPLSKIKAAKTGQRRNIEYGQLRNTRGGAKAAKPKRRFFAAR